MSLATTNFLEYFKTLSPEQQQQLIALQQNTIEAKQTATADPAPLSFTLNGTTYTHIHGTEHFRTSHTPKPLTLNTLLEKEIPDLYKSYRRHLQMPPDFIYFSQTPRRKIVRAAQLHFDPPPITPEVRILSPIFEALLEPGATGAYYNFVSDFKACLWATNNNTSLATSLFIHHGLAQTFPHNSLDANSIYSITYTSEYVKISTINTYTIQDRLDDAFMNMRLNNHSKIQSQDLIRIGMTSFYSYNNTGASLSLATRTAVYAAVKDYADALSNSLKNSDPEPPRVLDPETFLPPEDYYFNFSDFQFSAEQGAASKQADYTSRAKTRISDTLLSKIPYFVAEKPEITTAELLTYINRNTLQRALKRGLITRIKHGYYAINLEASPLDCGASSALRASGSGEEKDSDIRSDIAKIVGKGRKLDMAAREKASRALNAERAKRQERKEAKVDFDILREKEINDKLSKYYQ